MKIVDRKTFLTLPAGTLYIKFRRHFFNDYLCIKESDNNGGMSEDWSYTALYGDLDVNDSEEFTDKLDQYIKTGETFRFDLEDNCTRDGYFDDDQLFAVYDKEDIGILINRLRGLIDNESS